MLAVQAQQEQDGAALSMHLRQSQAQALGNHMLFPIYASHKATARAAILLLNLVWTQGVTCILCYCRHDCSTRIGRQIDLAHCAVVVCCDGQGPEVVGRGHMQAIQAENGALRAGFGEAAAAAPVAADAIDAAEAQVCQSPIRPVQRSDTSA